MPLCTIFTKCPAPSVPMCVQHGSPSTCAEIFSRIGPSDSYDSRRPARHDRRARSTRPPRRRTPRTRRNGCPSRCRAACRRRVSANCALPPSMMMSPGSTSAASSSITASVGPPALTMIRIFRGAASDATKSAVDSDATKRRHQSRARRSAPCVLAYDRLCTAVTNPFRAKFRARFDPITANPVTPISALAARPCQLICVSCSVARCEQVTDRRGRRRAGMVRTQRARAGFRLQCRAAR